MAFNEKLRTRVLLWCDRHCCLCKKACGVNIEVDHLIPQSAGGKDEIDNALPLCFECHSEVHRYNDEHPRGTKFKPDELRARREQVYEEFTRHLVPPVHWEVSQALPNGASRRFPNVGFALAHFGDSLPVHVLVVASRVNPNGSLATLDGYYGGTRRWRLNPRFTVLGHFTIPGEPALQSQEVRLKTEVTIIDQYDRNHALLPIEYVYVPENGVCQGSCRMRV